MLDESKKVEAQSEEKAPAVVGQLKISNDLLDFSSLKKKKPSTKCADGSCESQENKDLTPRERAILARKKKKENE